jgi:hypothetical protein
MYALKYEKGINTGSSSRGVINAPVSGAKRPISSDSKNSNPIYDGSRRVNDFRMRELAKPK